MSRLSLITGAETLAASFHLLIDDILLAAGNDEKNRELAALLRAAAAAAHGATNHEGLLFDSLLRDVDGKARSDFGALADALEENRLTPQDRRALGEIAERISSERAALSNRIAHW